MLEFDLAIGGLFLPLARSRWAFVGTLEGETARVSKDWMVEFIRYGIRTIPSASREEAQLRVIRLYREWLRLIPEVVDNMTLDISIPAFRRKVRLEFERQRSHSDLAVIDALIVKGTAELQETHNIWKQKVHTMYKLEDSASYLRLAEEKKSFLQRFLSGSPIE